MIYRFHTPAPPLSHYIQHFWYSADAPLDARGRVLPSGTMELVINLRDDEIRIFDPTQMGEPYRLSGAVISGAYSRYFDPQVHALVLGVHFRPGGAAPFVGVSAGELADCHVDLECIWGPAAREIRERLCEAAAPQAQFALLETMLIQRLRRSPEPHPAVQAALTALNMADETVTIREVARDIGLCQRRLIQVFTGCVGLTPKRYQRVCRFQRLREVVRHTASPDWAEMALECGYFDQSHLIHEFRQFTGFSPGEFTRMQNQRLLPSHLAQLP